MAQLGGVSGAPLLSLDTVEHPSDSSSESEDEESIMRRVLTPDSAAESSSTAGEKSWFKRFRKGSGEKGSLSIQSGDIIRSPTPTSPGTAANRPASRSSVLESASPTTMASPQGKIQGSSHVSSGASPPARVETASRHAAGASSMTASRRRGGCYGVIFPYLHFIVKGLFFSFGPCTRKMSMPIVSIGVLLGNFVYNIILIALCFTVYYPQVNINIESFGIPNHPSQMNWDAYSAAENGYYSNDSKLGYVMSPVNEGIVKRSSVVPRWVYPESCSENTHTQYALHVNWEMDLIFRVPASNEDDNILRRDRISYIHKVEETIYNSSQYKNFCHKSSKSNICDPLNSLLTWLYPRDPQTGQYLYNTPDGFTPDLPTTLHDLSSNLSVALWFTGGEVKFVNSSFVEGKLLRSQIRVGLPFPCFTNPSDRRDEQKALVTQYFVSLMPVFDQLSTSEVEILYGGAILFDYQVNAASYHDALLGFISLVMVGVLMFVLSGFSFWMTFMGLYSMITCYFPAYLVYTVVFRYESVGLLNIISLFVVIGIGVDDVFVFINTFKQSARLPDLKTSHERITHTILESTKATFFTSLTTSVAFFANVISSIPAVQQFGIFMALVVIFCFIQVFIVIPHSLYIWDCFFLHLENFCFIPCARLCKHKNQGTYSTLPDVRMSDLAAAESQRDEEDDSGIDSNSNSTSDNISNSSSQSDDVATIEMGVGGAGGVASGENVNLMIATSSLLPRPTHVTVVQPVGVILPEEESATFEQKLTMLMQKGMFCISVIPMAPNLLLSKLRKSYPSKTLRTLLRLGHIFLVVLALLAILGISFGLLLQLRFDDKQPQFFDPDSNIQKMLDLAGNVTDNSEINCYNCSAWNSHINIPITNGGGSSGGSTGGGGGGSTGGGGGGGGLKGVVALIPLLHPLHLLAQPHPLCPLAPQNPPLHDPPQSPPLHGPPQNPLPHPSQPRPPLTIATGAGPTAPTNPSGGGGGGGGQVTTPPTTVPPGKVTSSRFISNVPVYVVFGVDGVERQYDPTHVFKESGDENSAVLDLSFSDVFKCPNNAPTAGDPKLKGALRALCRICTNISNPENGLTLDGNFQCIPLSNSRLSYVRPCIQPLLSQLPECATVFSDFSKQSVTAKADVKRTSDGRYSKLIFLAMAFKSTTNEGKSPFDSVKDDEIWSDFLSSELNEILDKSGAGELYEGAQVLRTAFQTSEHWVKANLETVAVYGSFYGIILSFILCSLVVIFLAHDFRIVFAMVITIVEILLTLGGLFWCFGWRLGIVEAISLSILVGNSLDYCIHLSEGYVAMDARHVAFVESFKFTAGAPLRVKRVMAAISFIGVSIFSSAITTILAILPLLLTHIQLFTRFGQILLLDTGVAIIYTLVICSTCLALFGPATSERTWVRVLNAVLTILSSFVFYSLIFAALYIAYKYFQVYIPSPQGGQLYS